MINPTTPEAAREVLEVEIKSLIVGNYTPSTPTTPARLNATKASQEITALFIAAHKRLEAKKDIHIVDMDKGERP
jgi:hypothetical protein